MAKKVTNVFDDIEKAKAARDAVIKGLSENLAAATAERMAATNAATDAMTNGDAEKYIAAKDAEKKAADKELFYRAQLTATEESKIYSGDEAAQKIKEIRAAITEETSDNMRQLAGILTTAQKIAAEVKVKAVKGAVAEDYVMGNNRVAMGVNTHVIAINALLNSIGNALKNDYIKPYL